MPYFADGEIEMTTSRLLQDYLVERLREEYLPRNEPSRSEHDCAPAAFRVVCDDGDDD